MKQLTLFVVAASMLLSCSKNNTTEPNNQTPDPAKTPQELLIGAWTVVSAISSEAGNPSVLPDCSKDNLVTFNSDGKTILDEGATKCDSMDAQMSTGTWKMANYPTLEFKEDVATVYTVVKIIQLDETYLKYEMPVDTRTFTFTLKRK